MTRVRRAVIALTLVALAVPLLGATAGAQELAEARLTIRKIDTTDFPQVRISALSTGERPATADFTLRENGEFVRDFELVPLANTGTQVGVVLAIDVSGSMAENSAMDQAKAAARQFVQQRAPHTRIALVTFGPTDQVVVNFTTDNGHLMSAIDELVPAGDRGTAMWDGVRTGLGLYDRRPELQPNLVLLSDGGDVGSAATEEEARAAALDAKAAVFSVGLQGDGFQEGPVRRLAEATGGTYAGTSDPTALSQLYADVQASIENQYEIRYTSTAETSSLDLLLSAAGAQAEASVNLGTVSEGQQTSPRIVANDDGILTGALGKWLAFFLGAAALGLLLYAVALLFLRDESMLSTMLRPYQGALVTADADEDHSIAENRFVQRAVNMTEDFAERRQLLPKIESMLESADLPLRAAEALFFYVAGVVVFGIIGMLLGGSILMGLLILLALALVPPAALSFLAKRRRKKFVSQLPDMLQLLGSSLRAGYSLLQAVDAVALEVENPMGKELRRVLAESQLGRPLEEALEDAAERMDSPDFAWTVMAIRIQREVGGNLAELLDTVAETMISRERLRREVSALTAEGRVSALVLGVLPILIGFALYALNPEYIGLLFEETVGQFMLGGAVVLALFGFYWMKKIIEIEI